MVLNERQKKLVNEMVKEEIQILKNEGRDPKFIIDDIWDCITGSVEWNYELYDFRDNKDPFVNYGYSIMDEIIKEVYGSSPMDYHLNKITDGNGKIFKNVT